MSRTRNVIWSEGLFLTPQLFQQADRYRDSQLHFRVKPLTAFYWGLTDLEVDRDGLENGFFTLYRCSGVWPDGLPVQIPDEDAAPQARSFKALFAPSAESLDVYLAIPARHPDAVNVRVDTNGGGRMPRYQLELLRVTDETVEGNEC